MTYKVTNKVAMPPSRIRTPKYPFWDMAIGDSFFVPSEDVSKTALKQSCYYAARQSEDSKGRRWKWRIVDEEKGYRVFRVE